MIFITPVLGIIGIIGGLLCATADLLLDLKGTKNKKLDFVLEQRSLRSSLMHQAAVLRVWGLRHMGC